MSAFVSIPMSFKPVAILQNKLLSLPEDQKVTFPVSNYFFEGVYVREMTMKANQVCIGATHACDHLFKVQEGSCVLNINGRFKQVEAPWELEVPKETKKAIFSITDLVIVTFHKTYETDVTKLETILIDQQTEILIGEYQCH